MLDFMKEFYFNNFYEINFIIFIIVGLLLFFVSCLIIIKYDKKENKQLNKISEYNNFFQKIENFKL